MKVLQRMLIKSGYKPKFQPSKHLIYNSIYKFSTSENIVDNIVEKPKVYVVNRSAGYTSYQTSLTWMQDLVALKADKEIPDDPCVLFIVQHPPVYTLGKAATLDNLKFDTNPETCPFELHRLERGGEVTYHGPGQLTIYPVLNLKHFKKDLHWYVHRLEDMVSNVLQKYDIVGKGDPVNPGVWIGDSKIAAVGIKVSRWMSMHGVGLNVKKEAVDGFLRIIPCGIKDKQVTAIEYMTNKPVDIQVVADEIVQAFGKEFNAEMIQDVNEISAQYMKEPYIIVNQSQHESL